MSFEELPWVSFEELAAQALSLKPRGAGKISLNLEKQATFLNLASARAEMRIDQLRNIQNGCVFLKIRGLVVAYVLC